MGFWRRCWLHETLSRPDWLIHARTGTDKLRTSQLRGEQHSTDSFRTKVPSGKSQTLTIHETRSQVMTSMSLTGSEQHSTGLLG